MKPVDPIQHYCSEILELQEGGSKISDYKAGLTSDMKGRWTIGAFQHSKANKKETPSLKEDGYMEHRYSNPEISALKHMGFHWVPKDKEWFNDSRGRTELSVHKDMADNRIVLMTAGYDEDGQYTEDYESFKDIQELEEYLG